MPKKGTSEFEVKVSDFEEGIATYIRLFITSLITFLFAL